MDGKTHKLGGICTGLVLTVKYVQYEQQSLYTILPCAALFAGSVVGSLLPDIDHQDSIIGKKFKPISFVINKGFGHRGLMHAPIIYILLFMLNTLIIDAFVPNLYLKITLISFVIGVLFGALNHLLLDIITIAGIPLLYPLSKKKTHILPLKTKNKSSKLIVNVFLLISTFLLILF